MIFWTFDIASANGLYYGILEGEEGRCPLFTTREKAVEELKRRYPKLAERGLRGFEYTSDPRDRHEILINVIEAEVIA